MVSLKNWWTLPRKNHKPTSWSPLYTVYFTLISLIMDLGELNTFINPNFDLLILPDSHRIPEQNTIQNTEFLLGVELPQEKPPSFQNTTTCFHSSMIHLNYHLMKFFHPSIHVLLLFPKYWLNGLAILLFPKHPKTSYSFILTLPTLGGSNRSLILGVSFFFRSESARSQACNLVFWSWPKESMMQTIRSKDRIWDSVFQIPQGDVVRKSEMGVKGGDGSAVLATGDSYKVGPATFGLYNCRVNAGKYSIHGAYGYGKTFMNNRQTWLFWAWSMRGWKFRKKTKNIKVGLSGCEFYE